MPAADAVGVGVGVGGPVVGARSSTVATEACSIVTLDGAPSPVASRPSSRGPAGATAPWRAMSTARA